MPRLATFVLLATFWTAHGNSAEFPRGDYGAVGPHLLAMDDMATAAHAAATMAANAATVEQVKRQADVVFGYVWGASSGLIQQPGAAMVHGWKSRWQVTYSDFDPAFEARYGNAPPRVTDPENLGIVGRGRYVRRELTAADNRPSPELRPIVEQLISSLNNVIGWTRMDDGVTKAERQPRVDLTYQWDAPKAFWQSSADTGWLFEVQAQALNILKSNYAGDLVTARRHARDLVKLIEKCRDGVDANHDGTVGAVMMEGGLNAVNVAAREAGLL
ncbi:MAG: hypothetical protein O7E57_07050 [Gammaproteobacteria bacterium]|nr:hypothetical protein [Gammaproteobacteria bacterium]